MKNPVEIQDLNKNLFQFKFSTKRDADTIRRSGPWNFDRNLIILDRISGEEQPSDLDMFRVSFWVWVYDLPLKLRSEAMARKIGSIIEVFEEVDPKECNRMGRFLRLKNSLDLRKPLKRGTVIKFQGRDLWVDFKYERLPTFCFGCGRIGHQLKDCEEVKIPDDENYSELEEKDQAFGPWLRASPLPKFTGEQKKDISSGTCSKNLFVSSSNSKSKISAGDGGKDAEEEVEQTKNPEKGVFMEAKEADLEVDKTLREVEGMAESLATVVISTIFAAGASEPRKKKGKGGKWVCQKECRNTKGQKNKKESFELGKRQLVEVMI